MIFPLRNKPKNRRAISNGCRSNSVTWNTISRRASSADRTGWPPFLAIGVLLLAIPLPGQAADHSPSRRVRITESWNLTPNATQRIEANLQLPIDSPAIQTIHTIVLAPQPQHIYRHQGQNYAFYRFENPNEPISIRMQCELTIHNRDLCTALRQAPDPAVVLPPDTPWLRPEPWIESNHPEITALAGTLKKKSVPATLRAIYDHVTLSMTYTGYATQDQGALTASRQGSGDCSEYADLFIALCRACAIPARIAHGYTLEYEATPRHSWAEVFLDGYGWIQFDPTMGDQPDPILRQLFFDHLRPIYITTSNLRNDPMIHNSHAWRISNIGGQLEVETGLLLEISGE